jgi:tetratricopeptide (TPR) repeat protein/WD40 repeat protein
MSPADAEVRRLAGKDNPFPGLRPFEAAEAEYFFGREQETNDLLSRLRQARFLAVLGDSGSGKSSLVRAGLLPSLQAGFMVDTGGSWQIAVLRPGEDPLASLAAALCRLQAPAGPATRPEAERVGIMLARLRRGALGLVEAAQALPMLPKGRLLVVIDQFEELFRFTHGPAFKEHAEKVQAFVKLLLRAIGQRELPIYVLLTMRSEYLGHCAAVPGLAEAISAGLYLIPQMTRDQLRETIEGPIELAGGQITNRLVNRLLNDLRGDTDQLPVLQHALMRLWSLARRQDNGALDLADYQRIAGDAPASLATAEQTGGEDRAEAPAESAGWLALALSRHADEAYAQLGQRQQAIAQSLFRCLSERGEKGLDTRRPTALKAVAAVACASDAEVAEVVEAFRQPELSFLTPSPPTPLAADTILDISHESLIRNWDRLGHWVEEEARAAAEYLRLEDSARREHLNEAALYRPPDLDNSLRWREKEKPSPSWAQRYGGDFRLAMQFLDRSLQAWRREQEEAAAARLSEKRSRRVRRFAWAGSAVLVLLVVLAAGAWWYVEDQNQVLNLKNNELESQRQELQHTSQELKDTGQHHAEKLAELSMVFAQKGDLGRGAALLADAMNTDRGPENRLRLSSMLSAFPRLHRFWAYQGRVITAAFSPDGRWVVGAFREDDKGTIVFRVRVLDVERDKVLADFPLQYAVKQVYFLSDNQLLIQEQKKAESAGKEEVKDYLYVYDLRASPRKTELFAATPGRRLVAVSPQSRRFAVMAEKTYGASFLAPQDARSLDDTGLDRKTGTSADPSIIQRTRPTRSLLSVFAFGKKLVKRVILEKESEEGHATWAAFSNDGEKLVLAGVEKFTVWDLKVLKRLDARAPAIPVTSFSLARLWQRPRDGTLFVAASRFEPGKTSTQQKITGIVFWDVMGGKQDFVLDDYDKVTGLYPSSDGRWLVTLSTDQKARSWDLGRSSYPTNANGDSVTGPGSKNSSPTFGSRPRPITFDTRAASIRDAAFSPDGHWFATSSSDGSARVWRASGGSVSPPLNHGSAVIMGHFSPDGRYLLTATEDGTLRVWDMQPPLGLAYPTAQTRHPRLALASPDGAHFFLVNDDGRAWLCTTTSPRRDLLLKTTGWILQAWFSADGRCLATADGENHVDVWETAQGKRIAGFTHPTTIFEAFFSPQGERLLVINRGKGSLLYTADRYQRPVKLDDKRTISDAAFSGDGKALVLLSGNSFQVRDGVTGVLRVEQDLQGLAFQKVALDTSGSLLGLAGRGPEAWLVKLTALARDKQLLLETDSDKVALLKHPDPVSGIVFHPGGRQVLTWSGNMAAVWDATAVGNPAGTRKFEVKHNGVISRALFCDTGRALATAGGGEVQIWDAATGQALTTPVSTPEHITVPPDFGVFARDSRLFVQAGKQAWSWDLRSPAHEQKWAQLYVRGRFPHADDWTSLRKELSQGPDARTWHLQRLEFLQAAGDWSAALWHLDQLLLLPLADTMAQADRDLLETRRGDLLVGLGRLSEARQAYHAPWDKAAISLQEARQFLSQRKPEPAAAQHSLDAAEELLGPLARDAAGDLRTQDQFRALHGAYYELANYFFNGSKYVDAERALQQCRTIETRFVRYAAFAKTYAFWNVAELYRRLGQAYENAGKTQEAAEAVEKALATYLAAPPWELTNTDRDNVQALGRRFEQVANKMLQGLPADHDRLLPVEKFFNETLAFLQPFPKAEPSHELARVPILVCYGTLGRIALLKKDHAGAERHLRSGLAEARAWALAQPNYETAQRAVAVFVGDLGDVLLLHGNDSEALKDFEESATIWNKLATSNPTLLPYRSDALIRIGKLYLAHGNDAKANERLKESLDLFAVDRGRPAELEQEFRGWLTSNDPRYPGRGYSQTRKVTLRKGHLYQMDLKSKEFDSYLILKNSKGDMVASDDESGGGHDAHLDYRAPADGEYRVVVTTYGPAETGLYSLRIRPEPNKLVGQLNKVGGVYLKAARYKQALPQFSEATQLDPRSLVAWEGLGDAQLGLLESGAALRTFEHYVKLCEEELQKTPSDSLKRSLMLAQGRVGTAQLAIGQADAALKTYQRELTTAEELARAKANADAQRNLLLAQQHVGSALLALDRLGDARQTIEKNLAFAKQLASPGDVQAQRDLEIAYERLGDVLLKLGDAKGARQNYEKDVAISKQLAEANPRDAEAQRDLLISYEKLGNALLKVNDAHGALQAYEKQLEIAQQRFKARHHNITLEDRTLAIAFSKVGDAQLQLGEKTEARRSYEKYVDIAGQVSQANPGDPNAQRDLLIAYERFGDVLLKLNDPQAARQAFAKELQIAKEWLKAGRADILDRLALAIAYGRIGDAQRRLGATKEALRNYEKYVEVAKQLADARPADTRVLRSLVVSRERLGDTLLALDDVKGATRAFEIELQHARQWAKVDSTIDAKRSLAIAHGRLGKALLRLGDAKAARSNYEEQLAVTRRLAEADPGNAPVQRDLELAYEDLGDVLLKLGDARGARQNYEKDLAISKQLAEARPGDKQAQYDLLLAYQKLGDALGKLKDLKAARQADENVLQIAKKQAAAAPTNVPAQRNLAVAYGRLGSALLNLGDARGAVDNYRQRVEIRRALFKAQETAANRDGLVSALGNLSFADLFNRRPRQAIAAAEEALKLDPKKDWIRTNLAHGYLFDNQFERARAIYLKYRQVELSPKQTFAAAALEDFKELRQQGVTHPDMERIERLLSTPSTPPRIKPPGKR